jgi:hypothetical protein
MASIAPSGTGSSVSLDSLVSLIRPGDFLWLHQDEYSIRAWGV